MSLLTLRVARFPISILISALVLVGVLLYPGPAYGVGVTVDTGSDIGDSSFALGSTLSFNMTVTLAEDEFLANTATVSLAVAASTSADAGPETVTVALPVTPGAFTVTDTGSVSGSTLDDVTVTGTVTHGSGVSAGDFSGYGYGYGYLGAAGGGTLTYALNFSHRVLRDPAPTILPTLPASENLFTVAVSGAVGASSGQQGGGEGEIPNFPDFQFGGGIFAPGTPYDAVVRGLAAVKEGGQTKVSAIVDGMSGQTDVYVKIGQDQWGSYSEYSLNFPNVSPNGWSWDPDLSGIEALSLTSTGQILVAGGVSAENGDPATNRYLLRFGLTCQGGNCSGNAMPDDMSLVAAIDLDSVLTTGARVGGLAVDLANNKAYVSEFQTDLTKMVAVIPVDLSNNTAGAKLEISLGQVGYQGFDGLAHNSDTGTLYGSVGPDDQGNVGFMEFDTSGFPLSTSWVDSYDYNAWPTDNYNNVGGLGMALEGDKPILFAVAASEGKDLLMSTLAAAATQAQAGEFTNRAVFVDEDPDTGKVYVGVDGSPDQIQVFANGTYSSAITTITSGQIEAGTLVSGVSGADNVLWVADNATQGPTLRKIALSNGAELDSIALAGYVQEVGGLAHYIDSDVVYLVAYEMWNDTFHIVSTQSEQIQQTLQVNDSNYMDMVWPPGGANAAAVHGTGTAKKLLVGRFSQIYQINMANGDLETAQNVSAFEITGLGYDGSDLVFVNSDFQSQVKGSLVSGGVAQSLTVEGDYVMTATATSSGGATTSPAVNFSLAKLAQVVITITSPAANAVFNTTTVDVVGTVNDPTVTAITLAKGLASGNLVGKSLTEASDFSTTTDNATYTKTGLWKFTDQFPDFNSSSNKVAALSQGLPGSPNYNSGGIVQGTLDTKEISISAANTTLSFDYWYSTEPTPTPEPGWGLNQGYDRKKIEFCETGVSTCTLLAHIVSIVEDPMSSMMGGMMGGMGGGMGGGGMGGGGGMAFYFEPPPGTQYLPPGVTIGMDFQVDGETAIWVPRNRGGMGGGTRVLTPIEISLAAFSGKTGKVRFSFHSGDDFNQSPDEQGIVIDNVAVNGPITEGDTTSVSSGAFTLSFTAPEGTVTTKFIASSTVTGTASGETTLTTVVDTQAPTLVLTAPTSPTTFLSQSLSGSFTESSPTKLEVYVNSALKSKSTNLTADDTFSVTVGLSAGTNAISVTLTDDSGQTDTEYATITVDNTTPTITASVVPILSSSVVRPGDSFFVVVNATDSSDATQNTGIATVTHDMGAGAVTYAAIGSVAEVIQKKHSLATFGSSTATTHVVMGVVPTTAAAGSLPVNIDALDGAGNTGTATINLTVVSDLPDRTGFLREGFNYIGFPLVPSTSTFDDLLDQDITNANAALATALGRTPKLSDIVESVFTWSGGPGSAIGSLSAGSFLSYTPSAAADTLTDLQAKMGLLVNVSASVTVGGSEISVFDTAENPTVSGGSAVTVPIAWNVIGDYLPSGQATPPVKTVKTGFNLVTVHAPTDTQTFDNVFRGALVPNARAISATTSQNEVNAIYDADESGNISTLLNEGAELLFPTDTLAVMRSYWLQLADDPNAAVDPQI